MWQDFPGGGNPHLLVWDTGFNPGPRKIPYAARPSGPALHIREVIAMRSPGTLARGSSLHSSEAFTAKNIFPECGTPLKKKKTPQTNSNVASNQVVRALNYDWIQFRKPILQRERSYVLAAASPTTNWNYGLKSLRTFSYILQLHNEKKYN